MVSAKEIQAFRRTVRTHYKNKGRHLLPWRQTTDPYAILVSEIMLQQTQVPRVISKYEEWLTTFPSFERLATASPRQVLERWQGLGYNRRALSLQRLAQVVAREHAGMLPQNQATLESLPGIGPYTAAAVLAFAFDQRVVMIETNIRAVYLHHFFSEKSQVGDNELLPLIERSLPRRSFREWYAALMDYGTYLKRVNGNSSQRSKHHTKQSRFHGSDRQLRGAIVRLLVKEGSLTTAALAERLPFASRRINTSLTQLETEGFLNQHKGTVSLMS